MSRRNAGKRLLIGVPYLALYIAFIFPAVFLASVVLGAVELVYSLITGRRVQTIPAFVDRIWSFAGGNARYILTGRGSFDWLP